MTLVKLAAGQIAAYPYDLAQLRSDHPNVSFPADPDPASLAGFEVFPVELTAPPVPSPTQQLEELAPALVNGVWQQQFQLVDLPAEEAEAVLAAITAARREDVTAERDRRLAAGFDYNFGDSRGVHRIATTERDMRGWDEVSKGAAAAIALSQPSLAIQIVTETGPAVVTALEWQEVLSAAMEFRQPIWAASFALQAMDPIPADFANDSWWP
jgi:hypothetical protein